jgi:RecA-family ATPase
LWEPPKAEADADGADALPFVGFDDLQIEVQKPWLIKNVIAKGETSSWIGAPGKGKSALLTDVAIHVAAKRDWRGYKSKGKFGVVYLALERSYLVTRRLVVYKRKHGFKGLPIAVVTKPVNLMEPAAIAVVVATINAVAAKYGFEIGLLIIDTFAKAIAYGNGDENSARDQNRIRGHLRDIQRQTNVHIALVGHTGKDEARGERGSNAALGDVDVEVRITGDLVKSATVTKANDQPEGPLMSFTLEPFEFRKDEDGNPIETFIVSDKTPDKGDMSPARPRSRLNHGEKVAWRG